MPLCRPDPAGRHKLMNLFRIKNFAADRGAATACTGTSTHSKSKKQSVQATKPVTAIGRIQD
jgi:hypothetical protein